MYWAIILSQYLQDVQAILYKLIQINITRDVIFILEE